MQTLGVSSLGFIKRREHREQQSIRFCCTTCSAGSMIRRHQQSRCLLMHVGTESAALRHSRAGFPFAALPRTDPVQDLVGIGQFAGAEREVLLPLTIWLASTLRSKGTGDARMADRGPLT